MLGCSQVTSQGPAAEVAFTGGAQAQAQRPGDAQLGAALGTLWAHAVNTRLILELAGDSRFIKVRPSWIVCQSAVLSLCSIHAHAVP